MNAMMEAFDYVRNERKPVLRPLLASRPASKVFLDGTCNWPRSGLKKGRRKAAGAGGSRIGWASRPLPMMLTSLNDRA